VTLNSNYPPSPGQNKLTLQKSEGKWSQEWVAISRDVVLLQDDGRETQEWTAQYVDPPYQYGLLPQESFADMVLSLPKCTGKGASSGCLILADPVDMGFYDDRRGWYDVSGCGVCNDYCRTVGGGANMWFSCKLAGTTTEHTSWNHNWGTPGNVFSWSKCAGKGAVSNPSSSRSDQEVSKTAMHYCDMSMSLLLGSTTSLGSLRAIKDKVVSKGLDYLPGRCCFDKPTTQDAYFGVYVSSEMKPLYCIREIMLQY
jgi:hypothetical protein